MSNNNLNHNAPGYNGNYDPGPSSRDSTVTSDDEDSELTVSNPEVPFVSRYGMVNATNVSITIAMFKMWITLTDSSVSHLTNTYCFMILILFT